MATILPLRQQLTPAVPPESSAEPCDHIHESTSRYDHELKVLTFLLVCPVCHTERVIHSQAYEPHFIPNAGPETATAGASVHELPTRREQPPLRRAA